MKWSKNLTQLQDALSILLPFREDVLPFLAQSGINISQIRFDPKPANLWFGILDFANRAGKIPSLVDALLAAYPDDPYLTAYKSNYIYDLGVDIKDVPWHNVIPDKQLEKILGKTSTLLPIHFLSDGIRAARCVVRILLPTSQGTRMGTGFLISDNLLVTNNHVLANEQEARDATIQFDYEEERPGHPKTSIPFKLHPQVVFRTSQPNDWTIVRINGDANNEFGYLTLRAEQLQHGDFVNIIQHPAGGYKQIGMYRNTVTYADDNVIQYLTDTEPGSSGSPVFTSNWEVVALHNSSGISREPAAADNRFRNQGINIQKVITALSAL